MNRIKRPEFYLPFFLNSLGLKKINLDPQHPNENLLVVSDYDSIPQVQEIERQSSPSRQIALDAFLAAHNENRPPIFTGLNLMGTAITTEFEISMVLSLLEQLELHYLAQAIVDDERPTVKAMLELKPQLLLMQPNVIIKSAYTGQQFSIENFLGVAARRRQIAMVTLITSYFDQLTQVPEYQQQAHAMKQAGLAEWREYVYLSHKERFGIPVEYHAIIDPIVAAFLNEENELESIMESLYDLLLRKSLFTKAYHIDVELLLYAAYAGYMLLQTDAQMNAYERRVLGFLQKCVAPETAKIFCSGYIGLHCTPVEELVFNNGRKYYSQPGKELISGLGFNWYCEIMPHLACEMFCLEFTRKEVNDRRLDMLTGFYQTKKADFSELCTSTMGATNSTTLRM